MKVALMKCPLKALLMSWLSMKWLSMNHHCARKTFYNIEPRYQSDYGIFVGRALREGEVEFPDVLPGFLISKDLFDNLLMYHQVPI
jgi:hypothetical protein